MGVYDGSESPTSELNGLPGACCGDYSGLSELGGYSLGRGADSEDLNDRDCHSPVSSIDEIERAVAGNYHTHSFWHVLRKEDDIWVKKCMECEVEGPRPRGRPKRTWREVVREDCQARKMNKEDAVDRCIWRKMIKDVR